MSTTDVRVYSWTGLRRTGRHSTHSLSPPGSPISARTEQCGWDSAPTGLISSLDGCRTLDCILPL
ncbi:hypothetical protein EYF80_059813 [Liparis tanakae]|uniref:Uncharacterized protein n=1 Tax=Liparis tanakae TaxID=230148 RepID=A0A4Z2EM56_9TELE|nr:hypothetical protein EYF80_059813 [Liparis tanakae]